MVKTNVMKLFSCFLVGVLYFISLCLGLINFALMFIQGLQIQLDSLACVYPVFFNTAIEGAILFQPCVLDTFVEDLLSIYMYFFLASLLHFIGLYICCQLAPNCLYYYGFVICFETRICETSNIPSLLRFLGESRLFKILFRLQDDFFLFLL